MNRSVIFLLLAYSLCLIAPIVHADDGDYLVNAGDSLFVSVWRDEELSGQVLVAPDGKCTFPLVGEFVAEGRTLSEVRDELSRQLEPYIPDPVVTVSLADISGNRIYVIGQVNSPGAYVMNPSLDIMQALSVAGGTTPFADLKSIKILRRTDGRQVALNFSYDDVTKGRDLEQNITLQSGDVVVVP